MVEVTCKCGHKRNITAKQFKDGWIPDLCYDCWKKFQDNEIAKDNAKIRDEQLAKGYPELVGTEKQVLWAYKLRQIWILTLEDLINGDYNHDKAYEKGVEYLEKTLENTDSKFYINNRHIEMVVDVFHYINDYLFSDAVENSFK